jgi:bacterioferritin-associated ferredoxin
MYICICNAVNESAIHQAVEEGASNFRDLSFRTGCGLQCGSCVKLARQVLDQALAKAGVSQSPVELQVVSAP